MFYPYSRLLLGLLFEYAWSLPVAFDGTYSQPLRYDMLLNDLPMSSLVAAYTDDESSLTQQGNMLANHATANA